MRIVVIADMAEPSGGAQSVALQSALALAGRGCAVTYIHGIAAPADPRLAEAGIDVVCLGLTDVWDLSPVAGAMSGVWNREAARRLAIALRSVPPGPTVLHLHQWTRSLSPAVFPVLIGSPHPVVVTLHDYFIACPNGLYYRFDLDEPCRLTPLSRACVSAPCDPRSSLHKAVRLVRSVATARAIRRAGFAVVHVSDRAQQTIEPFLPPCLSQYRIDNPVEIKRRPAASPSRDGAIAYVGRLTREKGADLLAAAGVAAGLPLLFIGEGPAEAEIRRLAPGATMAGWRERDEVDGMLSSGVMAIAAPSRWYETGPLTVYEAMAAGLPVIASTRSGASEKVVHGKTGLVVEPDIELLTAALRSMASGDSARTMGGEAYHRYWDAPLDAARHASRLLSVYTELLDGLPHRAAMA